jgi:GTPase SAR1 family protein
MIQAFNKQTPRDLQGSPDIRIVGPRSAGKTTFMAALARWPNSKSESPILSVKPFGDDAVNLINMAQDILEQGLSFAPSRLDADANNLPLYSLLIELKPAFLINRNIRFQISCRDYAGEVIRELRSGVSTFDLSTYLDDCANSSGLLLLLDGSSIEDKQYSQAFARLQTELAERLVGRDISLRNYRIAVVFNKAELSQVWINRNQIDKFVNLRFPKTKATLQEWSRTWGCSVNYFFCSAFGMKGSPPQPNFKKQARDDGGTYGVIANPSVWRPFGLVAPIYWLYTGKDDQRLRD